jgi:hypothetical protein
MMRYLGDGPKSKHRIHLSFIDIVDIAKGNFIQYLLLLLLLLFW